MNAESGVERAHRILEHHLDGGKRALAVEPRPRHGAGCGRVEADEEPCEGALPRAGLTDEPEGLADADLEGDVVHRHDLGAGPEETGPGEWEDPAESGDACHRFRGGRSGAEGERGDRLPAEWRDGTHQRPGVLVVGGGEDALRAAPLDDLPVAHHEHVIGGARYEREVVGDEQQGGVRCLHLRFEYPEYLRLDRDVECGRGLVSDHEVGSAGDRHGDHHSLALPSRQLMGVGACPALGLGDAHAFEELDGAFQCLAAVEAPMADERLCDLVPHSHDGVERRHRFLEDHRDVVAPDAAQRPLGERSQLLAVEHDPSLQLEAVSEQAEDGEGGEALA